MFDTTTITVTSFELAVAIWAAAAAAPRGGVYPAAVAERARAAAPKAWAPLVLPSWEHMLACGEAAASLTDGDCRPEHACSRPAPMTLRYGGGASSVSIRSERQGHFTVVIDGPATSSHHLRLAGAVDMIKVLGVTAATFVGGSDRVAEIRTAPNSYPLSLDKVDDILAHMAEEHRVAWAEAEAAHMAEEHRVAWAEAEAAREAELQAARDWAAAQ